MRVKDIAWSEKSICGGEDLLFTGFTEIGRFTVLNRLTGYGDGTFRDIETGYTDNTNRFWLASGMFDIREYPDLSIFEAANFVKAEATTVNPDAQRSE